MTPSKFKGQRFFKFPGETHYLDFGHSKLKAAHPVNYFLGGTTQHICVVITESPSRNPRERVPFSRIVADRK